MDDELVKLNSSRDLDDLRKYVSTLNTTFISSELSKTVWKNNGPTIIQTLFNGLEPTALSLEKKLQISEVILFEIEKKQLPARVAEKLVTILASEVDSFSNTHLLRIADVCCDMIRNPNSDSKFACWKELLPKVLHLVVTRTSVDHSGSQMTGEEFKNAVITSLCLSEWSPNIIVDLVAMFIDMPLNKEERSRVVKKICATIATLPADSIPPLVHQLMILTKNEHSITFFLALAQYFKTKLYDNIDRNIPSTNAAERNLENISNVEGTVLYHIVQHHGPLGLKEMLKALKQCQNVPQFILEPFYVTLLLALVSSSPTCEEDVLNMLRTGLARALTENDKINESAWLRTVLPNPVDVKTLINRVLENCFRSRDSLIKGVLMLGFNLLAAGRGGENLHAFGITILEDLVKRNKLFTSSVLEMLGNHYSQATDSSQYTECLVVLARKQPLCVTESTNAVVKILDSCTSLPVKTGTQIMAALLPLARLSHMIRDNLVNSLRKSLFSHDVEQRTMAVTGFLELLRDLKISNLNHLSQSMSQNFCNMSQLCSQSLTGAASQSNEGLCLEVLSLLSGVFKQQHQVKTMFYRGIYSAVRANPELGPYSLDYLQTHLWKWVEPDETAPPLRFNDSVAIVNNEAVLQEPLGDFILCMALMVSKLEDSNRSLKYNEQFDSICSRIAKSSVNSFNLELDDGSSILDSTAEANQKQEILRQILGVYEALMGYLLCSWKKSRTEKSQRFLDLFKGHTVVSDYARGLAKSDKKKNEKRLKNGEKKCFRFPTTVLDFKCCARLLSLINSESSSTATNESTGQLKNKRELHRYATRVAVEVIREARTQNPAEIARDCHSLGYLCNIGRTLFKSYVSRLAEAKLFDLPAAITGLQAFSDLLHLILSHFKSKLFNFLNEIAGEPVNSQEVIALHAILNKLLDQLDDVLAEETQEEEVKEDVQAKKVPVLYLAIVSCLVYEMDAGSAYALQAFEKVNTICRDRNIERPTEAKAMLTLLLTLHRRYHESYSLMFDIALSLCSQMNLIDDELQSEEHSKYKIINRRTANVCLVALCDALQQHFADIEWTINRFKSEAIVLTYPSVESTEQYHDELRVRETNLCRHVKHCARVLSAVCRIAVPTGIYSDSVLKCLETFYGRLSALTKYFTVKVSKFQVDLEAIKFDKTVRFVDSDLTKSMYCFTEHVIDDGISDAKGGNPSLLKQRVLKETKHIPKIVLEKEQYHKYLLQLSKRAKIDLAAKTKHTLVRDYRLFTRQVKELLEKDRQNELIESDVEETAADSSQPSSPIPAKRQRSMIIDDETCVSSP